MSDIRLRTWLIYTIMTSRRLRIAAFGGEIFTGLSVKFIRRDAYWYAWTYPALDRAASN